MTDLATHAPHPLDVPVSGFPGVRPMTTTLVHPSPLGPLRIVAERDCVVGLYLPRQPGPEGFARMEPAPEGSVAHRLAAELAEYFAGRLHVFETPVRPDGTPFQTDVWQALRAIEFGERTSYGAIAARLGRPSASRAVGAAVGQNPISIVVPCHRVVGANGALTGYAGGLPAKTWLLAHEAAPSRPR